MEKIFVVGDDDLDATNPRIIVIRGSATIAATATIIRHDDICQRQDQRYELPNQHRTMMMMMMEWMEFVLGRATQFNYLHVIRERYMKDTFYS